MPPNMSNYYQSPKWCKLDLQAYPTVDYNQQLAKNTWSCFDTHAAHYYSTEYRMQRVTDEQLYSHWQKQNLYKT